MVQVKAAKSIRLELQIILPGYSGKISTHTGSEQSRGRPAVVERIHSSPAVESVEETMGRGMTFQAEVREEMNFLKYRNECWAEVVAEHTLAWKLQLDFREQLFGMTRR